MPERWLREVERAFDGRVLGIDNAVSDHWGRMRAIRFCIIYEASAVPCNVRLLDPLLSQNAAENTPLDRG